MKRSVILVLAALLVSSAAMAETNYTLGVKAGGGMSKMNIEGGDWKMGFDGGAFFDVEFSPGYSIQAEFLYAMKGLKLDLMGMGEFEWKLDYIEIPILLKRKLITEGDVRPVFFAGPAIGILSSANQKVEFMGEEEEVDIKDVFTSTDIGLVVGAGLDWMVGTSGKLTLDARFTISLTDNFDKSSQEVEDIVTDESLRNWNLALMVGYGFQL